MMCGWTPKVSHAGGDRSADVVQNPAGNAGRARPERDLIAGPAGKAAGATLAEELIACRAPWHDWPIMARHHRHDRQHMRASVLRTRGRQRPDASVEIQFRPAQAADLRAPRRRIRISSLTIRP